MSSRAEGREKVRGEYGFSSLVKQNKKAKIYAVFCFAGKKNYYFIFMLMMMIVLLLFLQKQNLANAIYLFGLGTLLDCEAKI